MSVVWLLSFGALRALAEEAGAEEATYDFQDVFYAFVILGLLILVGRFVRQKIRLLQKLFIPSSIVAGIIALLLGGEALGAIATSLMGEETVLANGLFPGPIQEVWAASPGVFINVVFAALFLGQPIPSPQRIWQQAAPQVVLGQVIAWGQYVVGILIALLILVPFFGMSPISGVLIEMSFEGGHGTAAGMSQTLADLGFEEGGDMALGLATVGIVTAIIAGTALADWARKKGHVQTSGSEDIGSEQSPSNASSSEVQMEEGQMSTEDYQHRPDGTWRELLVDPLTLHFGYVGLAIALGWIILQGLIWIESITWNAGGEGLEILGNIPLFPLALIGGILVQIGLEKLGRGYLVSPRLMNRIAGVALDVTVVTALASISLTVLGANLAPFLILSVAGVAWSVFAFVYLAPRIFPAYWFEKGIADMGQSMGVTATGLVLLQIVDKDNRSGAYESFGYKQLFFEPIVGGGLFTGAAPTLIGQFGMVPVLGFTAAILIGWLIFGYLAFWRKNGAIAHRS
ncbi:sodium:glutamate symporter [Pseudanabaena sp. FACHB-2040]|nr:sodium:glutamate symporter [Pseudanabaena sp. FACHB-2040]